MPCRERAAICAAGLPLNVGAYCRSVESIGGRQSVSEPDASEFMTELS